MVGMGMIFDDTYRPFFENVKVRGLYDRSFGDVDVPLVAVASKTGQRADRYQQQAKSLGMEFQSFRGDDSVQDLLKQNLTFACVATPDNRHFEASKAILQAGVHLLIEKPSVLSLQELDELVALAKDRGVLARVVYHKLLDPDHKKLRTLVYDNVLQHVNNGYCSLLEPRQISGAQFSEWITGRNPGTYVAVHYLKLIDFTFGGRLKTVTCTGQRGIVGPADGNTWDSVQLRLIYEYDSGARSGFRYSHVVGHAGQFSRLCRAGSSVPFRQWHLERTFSQTRSRGHRREPDTDPHEEFHQQSLQRHVRGTVGRTEPARIRN